MRRMRAFAASLAAVSVLATACGRLTGVGDGGGIGHPTGPDELVLRVEVGGGFFPASFSLRQLPTFSLLGDGRVITQGPQIEIYPGPALPNLLVTQITEDGVQKILEVARGAGLLGPERHYDCGSVADAPTTTFTLVAGGERHVISAYALAEALDCPDLSEAEREARAELLDFHTKVSDLRSWLPAGSVGEERPFEFTELRVFAGSFETIPDPDPGLELAVVDWPLSPPLGSFGQPVDDLQGVRCGVVKGDDLAALLGLVRSANELTPWRSEGTSYHLLFRPLLPDEHGC